MKKIYQGFTTGIFIGIIISTIFSTIYEIGEFRIAAPEYYTKFNNELIATIFAFIMFGLIGVLSTLASEVFKKIDNLLKATIIHYILMIIIIFSIGYFMKWFSFSHLLSGIFSITIVYILIYSIIYFFEKNKINKINEKLK